MRPLLPLLFALALSIGVHAADAPPPPASGDAARIAADIIKARALDAAGAGQLELSTQLQSLAKGLLDGRISLQDASLVMQIAATPRTGVVQTAAMTPEAKASAQRAASLLDGDSPAPARPEASPNAPVTPKLSTEKPPLALPTMPNAGQGEKPKGLLGKVYAIDSGSDGKANVAAIGVGASSGVTVGQQFTIQRNGRAIAQCKVIKVVQNMSYAEIVKGSLIDPKDDVKEDDVVTTNP